MTFYLAFRMKKFIWINIYIFVAPGTRRSSLCCRSRCIRCWMSRIRLGDTFSLGIIVWFRNHSEMCMRTFFSENSWWRMFRTSCSIFIFEKERVDDYRCCMVSRWSNSGYRYLQKQIVFTQWWRWTSSVSWTWFLNISNKICICWHRYYVTNDYFLVQCKFYLFYT